MALTDKLTAIGNAIRSKTGGTAQLTLDGMVTAINGIETGTGGVEIPDSAFEFTGNCSYKFSDNTFLWFINNYGDKITTTSLTGLDYMFLNSTGLVNIPFSINQNITSYFSMNSMFAGCTNLKTLPVVNGYPSSMMSFCEGCYRLRIIPENFASNINWGRIHTSSSCNMSRMFYNCYSLRKIPTTLLQNLYHKGNNLGAPYSYFCYYCHSLDELVGLGVSTSTFTSNAFTFTLNNCSRLSRFTFDTDNGVPKTANWKNQAINLRTNTGWGDAFNDASFYITQLNSGITADKEVTNSETYQSLKNDPDWWTLNVAYSRYNHDSAVETINTLPDTSAYLSSNDGTNTIWFIGDAGSATDGGAINTLTETEIAVATAKGWTVAFS